MRTKVLLATFLLVVGFCLAPAVGHGEVILGLDFTLGEELELVYREEPLWDEVKRVYREMSLLRLRIKLNEARVNYMMLNPTTFLFVTMLYDQDGRTFSEGFFPEGVVDTKGMICLLISDNLDVFANKSGTSLLEKFKRELEIIYSYIDHIVTDMNIDIVAEFDSKGGIPLGYFYRGEYHLWEE